MKQIDILNLMRTRPLFSINDLSRVLRKKPEYVKLVAYRLEKKGMIKKIERGKYTVHDDPMIFSSHIIVPSYIGLWTAMRFHNLTEQQPKEIMVISPKPKNSVRFEGTTITFTKLKHFWGYKKERYREFDIFMAEKEKTIIDGLLTKKIPLDEILNAVKSGLDTTKLMDHTLRTGNSSLAKRIGYLLDHLGMDPERLLSIIDNNYISLDPHYKKSGTKNDKWKLIINRRLE
jgi:predicted transcriptional regulator of viral defense system